MRLKGVRKTGMWKRVLSTLAILAGGVCLLVIGAVSKPCGVKEVVVYEENTTYLSSAPAQPEKTEATKIEEVPVTKVVEQKKGSNIRKYGDLCGMIDSDVESLLLIDHSSQPWSKRYSWDYRWWTILEIIEHFASVPAKPVECLLLSVSNTLPCLEGECLLTLWVRPKASDIEVAKQIYDKLEYSFLEKYSPKTVLDAGGNIGLGALLFGTMFPDATVITIEPDHENYSMLKRNTKHLPNVIPLRAGLWWKVTALRIREKYLATGHEWEYVVEEVTKADVAAKTAGSAPIDFFPAVTVDYLAQLFNLGSFDFAKIDIEGSEREVFTRETFNHLSWLPKVKLLTVEQHENLKPGAEAAVAQTLTRTFSGVFELEQQAEYQIWTNKELIYEITRGYKARTSVAEVESNVDESSLETESNVDETSLETESSLEDAPPETGGALSEGSQDEDPLEKLVST